MSMSQDSGSERRRFVRYVLKATADVVFENDTEEQGKVHDISTAGMFLQLDSGIPKKLQDTKLKATVRAIASEKEFNIEAECSIVRSSEEGVALFFSSIDSSNREILHDLIGKLNEMVRDSRK